MADQFKFAQLQPFTLAGAGVSIGASTLVLNSFQTIDGTNLAMTDFGDIGFGTVDPGNGTREEQISFTGVTQNANGTATLTGISTVLFTTPYTKTANFAKSHAGGAVFVISNTAGFYDEFAVKDNDETITAKWTFPGGGNADAPVSGTVYAAPTNDLEYASKKYVDDVAVAGAPDATTSVKGIVELATAAETAAGTATGGTGANLVPWNSTFNATSSATVLVPVTNSSGKISSGFGGAASSLATLNGSSLVVENPANATATPTASKIVIADATAKINDGWIGLTTAGDTVYSDGTDLQRLAIGTANQVLTVNSGATAPEWKTVKVLTFKNGTGTRAGNTASGTQTFAHNLGVTPSYVRITARYYTNSGTSMSISDGVYNGTTTSSTSLFTDTGPLSVVSNSNIIEIYYTTSGSNNQKATISVDSTNITLTWTKAGTLYNGDIAIMWEAYGLV